MMMTRTKSCRFVYSRPMHKAKMRSSNVVNLIKDGFHTGIKQEIEQGGDRLKLRLTEDLVVVVVF